MKPAHRRLSNNADPAIVADQIDMINEDEPGLPAVFVCQRLDPQLL